MNVNIRLVLKISKERATSKITYCSKELVIHNSSYCDFKNKQVFLKFYVLTQFSLMSLYCCSDE